MSKATREDRATASLSVEQLSRAYVVHREALVRRATRKVMDQALAEEIVQEAFLKVILASPDIANSEHLLAYINTTVNNLCTSVARANGIRPELVAIDAEMTADEINDILQSTWTVVDDSLIRAEDSAIVREAISRLSSTDRAVLLAETYEGLNPREIAAKYGMTQESVHVAISRARKNLRGVLETWVINEETGLTAAQLLSRSYKKAYEHSKKIGTAALSLVLLLSAFFGFWNSPTTPVQVASPTVTVTVPPVTASPSPTSTATKTVTKTIAASPDSSAPAKRPSPDDLQTWALGYLSSKARLGWPGLDANGIPTGFTVNDGAGLVGLALLSQDNFVMDTDKGTITTTSRFTTFQDGLNVILPQTITNTLGKVTYKAEPIVRVGGSWIQLEIAETSTDVKQLDNGNYLITSWMTVDINKTAENTPIAGPGLGTDLTRVPAVVATRVYTTGIGQPVISQAVQVLDPLAGQS